MDLDTVKTDLLVSREFLAVVLAGFGTELVPLTADHGDEPCPKALLPVANRPMIDYVLSWIEQSGIKDVLLVCPAIHRPAIYHHIHSDVSSSNLTIDLQTYDETPDSSVGTCVLLRHFAHRIREDFVIIPCDFIAPPSLPLSTLLNRFRADYLSNGSIATTSWYVSQKHEKAVSPEEWGPSAPPAYVIWDDSSGTLLHVDTADDLERNSEELEVRMSLLSRYSRVRLSLNLRDSHVYVCSHSLLGILLEKQHHDSFREEFLPWLCKLQYQKLKRKKYGHRVLVLCSEDDMSSPKSTVLHHSTLKLNHVQDDFRRGAEASSIEEGNLKVGFVLCPLDAGFAIRVNNLGSFVEINRRMLSSANYALPTDPKNRALIDQKVQISSDSIIGDSTKVSEKSIIKMSIIGRHCVIGKMVKIVGCIMLDHCVVEDGAKLDGCVLGKNTKVGEKAELTRCVTQGGYDVRAGDILKNESLEITDWAAAPDDQDESGDDDETI